MIDNDFEKITELLNIYFKATYHGNTELLYKAFHPNARITGIVNDSVYDWSLPEFITRVTTLPTAENKGEKYDKEIVSIDKTNNAAMVKTRVAVGDFIFFDYITLLKIESQWVIRNKSFTN